jgi:hypothetical protein
MPDNDQTKPRFSFVFVLTFAVAILLYLVTNEPIVAVILPCLHGGWNTIHTGLWLRKSDPCLHRAKVCFVFYVATAFWKAAAAALLTIVLLGVAQEWIGVNPDLDEIIATMLVVMGGVVFNTILGLVAIGLAIRHRIRVWVHPRLRTMLHDDLGQVINLNPFQSGFNHAIVVVALALLFPPVIIGILTLALTTVDKNINDVAIVPTILAFLMVFAGPIAMIPCYAWLSSRILAKTPQQCWPVESLFQK